MMAVLLGLAAPAASRAQGAPTLPQDTPVMLIGDPAFRPVLPYTATFSMGRIEKAGPMTVGQRIEARAHQTMSLERSSKDGVPVLIRRFRTAGIDGQTFAEGQITMDAATLLPLSSKVVRGDETIGFNYDWEDFSVSPLTPVEDGEDSTVDRFDLRMLEAAVHDVWMAALPLREGFSARIPVMMAGAGKYWAVPRVVGSEETDIGDGISREAWVVELDWWGMGKDGESFFPGGGANGTGGSGGKYWVLKNPPAGMPPVVRVMTEVDEATDSVIQLQTIEK